jgi:hypothetical protein
VLYPSIDVYVIDNCGKEGDLGPIEHKSRVCDLIKTDGIHPLTYNQTCVSKTLFGKGYDYLIYAADDVIFKQNGFIEEAVLLFITNPNHHIISFATDQDPVAFIYDSTFFKEVGFNLSLKGKECTDNDLVYRVKLAYGSFPYIGEYWKPIGDGIGWESKYLEHAKGRMEGGEKEDVNKKLEKLGIDSGIKGNKYVIMLKKEY